MFLLWDPPCERLNYPLFCISLHAPSRRPARHRLTPVRPIPPPPELRPPRHPPDIRPPPVAFVLRPDRAPSDTCRHGRPRPPRLPPRTAPYRTPPSPISLGTRTRPVSHRPEPYPADTPHSRLTPARPGCIRLQPAHRVSRSTPVPTDPAHDLMNPMQLGMPARPRTHRPCPPPAGPPDYRLTTHEPRPCRPTHRQAGPPPSAFRQPRPPPDSVGSPLSNSPTRPPHETESGLCA